MNDIDRTALRAALAEALANRFPGNDDFDQAAGAILAHPAVLAALAGSEPAGLRKHLRGLHDSEGIVTPYGPDFRNCSICQAALAATPTASPTATEWLVHDHGPYEGRGMGCREYHLNGRLVGACLIHAATATGEREP